MNSQPKISASTQIRQSDNNSQQHNNSSILVNIGKGLGGLSTALAATPPLLKAMDYNVPPEWVNMMQPASYAMMLVSGLGVMMGSITGL